MCTEDCPIVVHVDGDEVLSVDHPDCVRAEGMMEQRASPHRWTKARIRDSAGDEWRSAPLPEVLSTSALRLLSIRDRYGPGAVAFVAGFTKEARPYLRRLAHAFGSPHYLTESSCCFGSGFVAAKVTLGAEYDYFLGPSRARRPETRCRLVWSANPSESRLPYDRHHLLGDVREVPTIVVDPRRTPLAELAEIHLPIRPGTDGALALGMAHVILREGLEEKEFLRRQAHGFDLYREYVKGFTPEVVAGITGVPAETVTAAARMYGRARPAQITISACSTVHHSNGFQNHRAILLLSALCGNLDRMGGNRPWGHRTRETGVDVEPSHPGRSGAPLGMDEHPIFVEHYGEGQAMRLAGAIEDGRIRGVFSLGMNVMMWPNSGRLRKALPRLEFFSVSDFFPTATTELASVFFPAATHLERQALLVAGGGQVRYRPVAVPPLGDAVGDTELIFALAGELGLGGQFWEGDIHASFDARLSGLGLSFTDLPRNGEVVDRGVEEPEEQGYLRSGFGTPTGKVEFVSTILEDAGYEGLPVYQEPFWSPVSTPEVAKAFPLILTSGARTRAFSHSQGRRLDTLRCRMPVPKVQLNPEDALSRGIRDGEDVRLSSPLGSIVMVAAVTDVVPTGTVSAPHGWSEADVNLLIPDEGLDPISGFPPFRSSLCQLERLSPP